MRVSDIPPRYKPLGGWKHGEYEGLFSKARELPAQKALACTFGSMREALAFVTNPRFYRGGVGLAAVRRGRTVYIHKEGAR